MLSHGAYRECGILPGEEMMLAISTESVIRTNNTPSAKQVRRAREKQLITVFREAMSRVASRSRRVYRADDMRHKSGRGMRCSSLFCAEPVREFAPPYKASDTEAAEQCFAYCVSSILPGEEMILAISTGSVIRTNNIPSGNTHTGISRGEYLLALRLANKLADLRAANANPCDVRRWV